jgi:hypothetical protein
VKRLGLVVAVALGGVAAIGLVAGDPRGTHSLERSEWIVGAALLLCICTTIVAWRSAHLSPFWLLPTALATVMGALSGWIAGVEFAGDTQTAVRLSMAPGKVLFLVAMTTAGMALPAAGVAAALRRFGRART